MKCISDNDISKGRYLITNYGDIAFSLCGKKWRKLQLEKDKDDYLCFKASNTKLDDNAKHIYLHREVATHFVPNDNPEDKKVVHHKDSNRHNNHYSNLEWMNESEHNKLPRKKKDEEIQEDLSSL